MNENTNEVQERSCKDWLDTYMEYTKHSEPHYMYRKWVGISTLAAAMQRKIWMEWGSGITLYPNMYVVLVGPPAARKGTALAQGRKLMSRCDTIKIAPDTITRQALIGEFANTNHSAPAAKGTNTVGAPHSSLTVCSPELTVFLGYNNMEFITDLTDWFDCPDYWSYHTKGSGNNQIINSFFNLIGATTPTLIRTALPTEAIGSGLASRIVFVYQKKMEKRVAYHEVTGEERQAGEYLVEDLQRICSMSMQLKPSECFIKAYSEWYNVGQDDERIITFQKFEHYLARRQIHLLKMSMIFAVSRNTDGAVTAEDFKKAHKLLLETEVNMPLTFAGMGNAPNSEVTMKIMAAFAEKGTKISLASLMSEFIGDVDVDGLHGVMDAILLMGVAEEVREGKGEIWYVGTGKT